MLIYNCFYQRQTRQKVYLKLLQVLFNTPQYRLYQNLPHLQQLRFLQGAISVLPQQVAGWLTCQSLRTFYQTQVRLTNSSVYYSIFFLKVIGFLIFSIDWGKELDRLQLSLTDQLDLIKSKQINKRIQHSNIGLDRNSFLNGVLIKVYQYFTLLFCNAYLQLFLPATNETKSLPQTTSSVIQHTPISPIPEFTTFAAVTLSSRSDISASSASSGVADLSVIANLLPNTGETN